MRVWEGDSIQGWSFPYVCSVSLARRVCTCRSCEATDEHPPFVALSNVVTLCEGETLYDVKTLWEPNWGGVPLINDH